MSCRIDLWVGALEAIEVASRHKYRKEKNEWMGRHSNKENMQKPTTTIGGSGRYEQQQHHFCYCEWKNEYVNATNEQRGKNTPAASMLQSGQA